ncbi:MAG: hypothetical protein M0Q49_03200 [Porticoccaceae bacterium]|nr:hypothetical protein [Porticoccaceae bacterium]
MPLIILNGPIKSGKSTTARALVDRTDGMIVAFADALREEVSQMYGIPMWQLTHPIFKEQHRPLLQQHGTDIRRNLFGDDYWIKKWTRAVGERFSHWGDLNPTDRFTTDGHTMHVPEGLLIITDDCRFHNERIVAQDYFNAFLVRLDPNPLHGDDPLQGQHASEVEWRQFVPDFTAPFVPVETRVDMILEALKARG